jgi:hypothetical protein
MWLDILIGFIIPQIITFGAIRLIEALNLI